MFGSKLTRANQREGDGKGAGLVEKQLAEVRGAGRLPRKHNTATLILLIKNSCGPHTYVFLFTQGTSESERKWAPLYEVNLALVLRLD